MPLSKASYILPILCGLAVLTSSPGAGADTLDQALAAAVQNHPSVESARAALKAADRDKASQFSGYFPELNVTATGGRLYGDNATSRGLSVTRGAGYSYLWEGSVTARQMIFDGFETPSRVGSADYNMRSAHYNLLDVRESLALRAAQSYLNLLRARTGLAMLIKQQNQINDYIARITNMVNEGAADEAELQQARDVGKLLDGFVADYSGQVRAAEAEYIEAVGRSPQGNLSRPVPGLQGVPKTIPQAVTYALESHPALRSAAFSSRAKDMDIEAEEASIYPDIDGEISYLKSDKADIIGGEVVDARGVVRMNWAFETGGGQLARIKKRKYEYEQAKAQADEIRRQIERSVRLAYSEYDTARQALTNLDERVELNEKLYATYEQQFEGAVIGLLQLMQADNALFNTRLEKLNAEFRVLAAQYGVLGSLGLLQQRFNLGAPTIHKAGTGDYDRR